MSLLDDWKEKKPPELAKAPKLSLIHISENGKVVIDLLKKLVKDENYCVIVVTHDLGIAAQADVCLLYTSRCV